MGTGCLRFSDKEVLDFLASCSVIGPGPCRSKVVLVGTRILPARPSTALVLVSRVCVCVCVGLH